MALRDFSRVRYLPLLAISIAEMRALQELSGMGKDELLPYMALQPWGVSEALENTLTRITAAYGDRPYIADIAPARRPATGLRPVHHELQQLRIPERGYANWCSFVEERPSIIPTVQLGDLEQLPTQIGRLSRLGRGLAVYLQAPQFGIMGQLAAAIGAQTGGGADTVVIVDLGQQTAGRLADQAIAAGFVRTMRQSMPLSAISLSASTFPSGFTGVDQQAIFERAHFDGVANAVGADLLIYSDRGSARAERQTGGGGAPAPRVDLAFNDHWTFFRDGDGDGDEPDDNGAEGDRIDAYIAQARRARRSNDWDNGLRIWATQMIERTAGGDRNAIKSPMSSTAVRINMHLHRQIHIDGGGLYDNDEEWSD